VTYGSYVVQIVPSILAADFARLGEQIQLVADAGARMIHVDIMDGHFVPNLTMGPPVTESLRKATKLKLDHHLMIEDPDTYAPAFIAAGADAVSVHYEACRNLNRTLNMIRDEGAKAGVVLNPHTIVDLLDDVLDIVDYVLVMSVNPGFGGQRFIPRSLEKVRHLDRLRRERRLNFSIEIDGGINLDNVGDAAQAGVNWVVVGSSVFQNNDPGNAYRDLQRKAEEALLIKV
jgi:ribulose-phosphate 3-epimerase